MSKKARRNRPQSTENAKANCKTSAQDSAQDHCYYQLEAHKLDDVDQKLLLEFREEKPVCQLKGEYRIGKRALYDRAIKLASKGFLKVTKDGNTKRYSLTSEAWDAIAKYVRGSEPDVASVSRKSPISSLSVVLNRAHNLVYQLPIQTQPKSLKRLLAKGSWVTGVKHKNMKNWGKFYGDYEFPGFVAYIEITTRNVFVRLRDIWAIDIPEAVAKANKRILLVKKELEETFSFPGQRAFRLGNWKRRNVAVVRGSHHALTNHPFAVECAKIGYSFDDGRLVVDKSKGIPELEGTHPGFSADDMDQLREDYAWQVRNQTSVRQLADSIDSLITVLEKSKKLQDELANQIYSLSHSDTTIAELLIGQQQLIIKLLSQQNQQSTILLAIKDYLSKLGREGGIN